MPRIECLVVLARDRGCSGVCIDAEAARAEHDDLLARVAPHGGAERVKVPDAERLLPRFGFFGAAVGEIVHGEFHPHLSMAIHQLNGLSILSAIEEDAL